MRTFRNLSYALIFLATICLFCLISFSQAHESMLVFTLLGVFVAMFAMSVVALLASLLMYFYTKSSNVTVLKRRAARVYGELLHHKTLLIAAIDGEKHVSDWNHYLYDPDDFPRTKKFLNEEYFLLLSCDSFMANSEAAKAYNAFRGLHDELTMFIRSINYDRTDCAKFRKRYRLKTGKELTTRTPVEKFYEHELLAETYEGLLQANEQALRTVEGLLVKIEALELELDKYYEAGLSWKANKKDLEARYQMWMNDTDA